MILQRIFDKSKPFIGLKRKIGLKFLFSSQCSLYVITIALPSTYRLQKRNRNGSSEQVRKHLSGLRAEFGCFAIVRMKFLAFLLTTLLACLAQRDDLLVGILGTSQQKRENFYQLTKPEIIPFLLDEAEPESSNWVIEEADRWRRFDYDKALRLVRKKFRENFQLRQPRVRVKYLPFATNEDLRKNIKLVSESSAKFKVFLFGRNSHDVTDVCGLVKGLSRVQNVSAIIWGCPETHTAIQNGLLSLQPKHSLFVHSFLSLLRHFKWRKVAWVRVLGKHSFSSCDQVVELALSSGYFVAKFFETLNFDLLNQDGNKTKLKEFWSRVFSSDVSGDVLLLTERL